MFNKRNYKVKIFMSILFSLLIGFSANFVFASKSSNAMVLINRNPRIVVPDNVTIDFNHAKELVDSIQATDYKEQMISSDHIQITGLNIKKVGKQKITITATDMKNRKTTIARTVFVVDHEKPVLKNVKDVTIPENSVSSFDKLTGVTAQDDVDGDLTTDIKVTGDVDTDKPGNYELIYTVSDRQKNTQTAKKIVTVTTVKESEKTRASTEAVEKTIGTDMTESTEALDFSVSEPAAETSDSVSDSVATVKKALISFENQVIPFVDATGADEAPATGCGTWIGSAAVDDDLPTYFIGHNPGDFSGVLNLQYGSKITVYDQDGNSKTYFVVEVIDMDDYGNNLNDSSDNISDRALYSSEEQIALQTCLTDSTNRLIIAK